MGSSVLFNPLDKVLAQKDPFLADLVGRQPLLIHELVQCLMTNVQKLLCLLEAQEDSLDFLFLLACLTHLRTLQSWFEAMVQQSEVFRHK